MTARTTCILLAALSRSAGSPLGEVSNVAGPPRYRVTRGGLVNYASTTCWEASRTDKAAERAATGPRDVGFRPVFVTRSMR